MKFCPLEMVAMELKTVSKYMKTRRSKEDPGVNHSEGAALSQCPAVPETVLGNLQGRVEKFKPLAVRNDPGRLTDSETECFQGAY